MQFEKFLYEQSKTIISSWNEENVYALSFLVNFSISNDNDEMSLKIIPEVSLGYNAEMDCDGSSKYSEERWNFAFWRQNNIDLIDIENKATMELLFNWYKDNNMDANNIGNTNENQYDEEMNYIGKGPYGYFELLMLVASVARKLQLDGIVKNKFGRIPIIVHNLEYSWYIKDATIYANPNGEANEFIIAYNQNFI